MPSLRLHARRPGGQVDAEQVEEGPAGAGLPRGLRVPLLSRVSKLEAEVQYLSQELRAEKLLWSSRYLELLREQQGLLVQLQGQGQALPLWLQDLEGPIKAWGTPDRPPCGPRHPEPTTRGVGTQTD
ncbi:hypothetical protein JRQ81_012032 [Phrynocephalus forsythii]|uniref:Uncharacterized protein n=1 Tax=Phrynocephalus forsythii TaxID=171643 RepID=A0A9Q1AQN8_9SAUR|nr:hypothetical protein JRQ81_012032 [Phrynocephalus forsythii]